MVRKDIPDLIANESVLRIARKLGQSVEDWRVVAAGSTRRMDFTDIPEPLREMILFRAAQMIITATAPLN